MFCLIYYFDKSEISLTWSYNCFFKEVRKSVAKYSSFDSALIKLVAFYLIDFAVKALSANLKLTLFPTMRANIELLSEKIIKNKL